MTAASKPRNAPARSRRRASGEPPLVLDLDGALLRTDLLHESAVAFFKAHPLRVFELIGWLFRGRAVLKRKLAEANLVDVAVLPFREELVAFASAAKARGRKVGIATAADERLAREIAERFGLDDFVIASDGKRNLKGASKAAALVEAFPEGFAYAGDGAADLVVWDRATSVILAGARPGIAAKVRALGKPVEAVFDRDRMSSRDWAKALRVHQWAKNALVFVPLVLSGMADDLLSVQHAIFAFAAMCMVSSGTCLINDLMDLADDRRHWSKKGRHIASGRLSIMSALSIALGLIAAALAVGFAYERVATEFIILYLVTTLGYSIYLKRLPIADVFTLAALFTLRLVVGIAAVDAPPSSWLLVFSMFIFTSLSFAKRQTEIQRSVSSGNASLFGRGYRIGDAPLVLSMGIATGMAAVLIMVLYIMDDFFTAQFYSHPWILWTLPCALFVWLGRIWLLCHRDELHDDPVLFAVKDGPSLALGAVCAASFLAGWLL